ncbi:hypothetical protein NP233_g7113 [Leucocoprinus birnbaumii]|uniref:Uncharacterized protein n=1 Tax=Leucocoprinus birnbaumii TaxID=56174 RepID=A0AAD5VPU2_9AGAR|nr:hypothetical protein NP233_g7113 [Leucocoprinus birnbaumii]
MIELVRQADGRYTRVKLVYNRKSVLLEKIDLETKNVIWQNLDPNGNPPNEFMIPPFCSVEEASRENTGNSGGEKTSSSAGKSKAPEAEKDLDDKGQKSLSETAYPE